MVPPGLLFRVVNNKNKLYKILNKIKLKYIDITKKKKTKTKTKTEIHKFLQLLSMMFHILDYQSYKLYFFQCT